MVPTCTKMVPSIPERDRWFLPVQRWFPAFLREADGSYLSEVGLESDKSKNQSGM
jgi:hypothetical protein